MIVTLSDLAGIRDRHKNNKLVLTSGTFDLFHVGHLRYLEQVKNYGDIVVVLLSGDRRVSARKGSSRPIIPEDDRAHILDALKVVDYVLIDPSLLGPNETDLVHARVIDALCPDFYVTDGPDPRFWSIMDTSQLVILPRAMGGDYASTSDIIRRIAALPQ